MDGVFPERSESLMLAFAQFLRERWLRILGVSALILLPCFWHYEIVSSDLGSHLYNAWLVQLIRRSEAPGLWIAPQHTNVLFDLLLSAFGSVFNLHSAEKLAVSVAVLIFFWGTFALAAAAARRAPWFVTPVMALVTYGWTFHLGFFNYYLSLGLSFFAIAIVWRGKGWERLTAVVMAPFVFVAHPLGFLWLLGASGYILIHRHVGPRGQVILFLAAIGLLGLLHLFLFRQYHVNAAAKPFYSFNGADQLVLFGERYRYIARALLGFAIVSLAADITWRDPVAPKNYALPLQLYFLVLIATGVLPEAVAFPPPIAAAALLTERLTSVAAALGCCLLGAMQPTKWHLAVSAAIAAVFFCFLYQDTAVVNQMESQIVELVSALPPNQRVMATILPPPGSRVLIQHIIDRACIGRCFSYGNYEPGAALFRVRAVPHNPYVLDRYDLAIDMENGGYVVQPEDLPVYQVYQCSDDGRQLCITPLQAGQVNDRLGVYTDK